MYSYMHVYIHSTQIGYCLHPLSNCPICITSTLFGPNVGGCSGFEPWLRRQHLSVERPICVFAERSSKTVALLIGILKAGLAYLPLDVKMPTSRIQSILSNFP